MKLASQYTTLRIAKKPQPDDITLAIKVTAKKENMEGFVELLQWMEYCASVGHSGEAKVFVDGDGAARIKFDGLPEWKEGQFDEAPYKGPELIIGLD